MESHLYLVDDDAAVLNSLVRLLSRYLEYKITTFASGDAFLARERDLPPGVVLLDYHMKGANGLAVLNSLQAVSPRFVTVMLTAHGGVTRSVDAMKAGAYNFLEKPYDPADLMGCIEDAFSALFTIIAKNSDRDTARAQLSKLSIREREVLSGLVEGHAHKIIAYHLGISPRTVEIYRANLSKKLGVRSLADLLRIVFVADGSDEKALAVAA